MSFEVYDVDRIGRAFTLQSWHPDAWSRSCRSPLPLTEDAAGQKSLCLRHGPATALRRPDFAGPSPALQIVGVITSQTSTPGDL